jgi:hypothetical protein
MEDDRRSYRICTPKSPGHGTAMRWFGSITRLYGRELDRADTPEAPDQRVSLQHATKFYSIYAETGDDRFRRLSDDFLQFVLAGAGTSEQARV